MHPAMDRTAGANAAKLVCGNETRRLISPVSKIVAIATSRAVFRKSSASLSWWIISVRVTYEIVQTRRRVTGHQWSERLEPGPRAL